MWSLAATYKRWQMMGGLHPDCSGLAARAGDCIITEDEVILQHKGGTGAENVIRTGCKRLEEHVNVLPWPKPSPGWQTHLCCKIKSLLLFLVLHIVASCTTWDICENIINHYYSHTGFSTTSGIVQSASLENQLFSFGSFLLVKVHMLLQSEACNRYEEADHRKNNISMELTKAL